jgi:L-ascorbate metabolism protein UlaG (beta-lactamase superfamily)
VLRVGDQTVFHAGDSDRVPEMSSLGEIDVALLPIGGTYTMAEAEAAEAVRMIRPTVAIPMHYGYATGGDPEKFASLVGADATVVIL